MQAIRKKKKQKKNFQQLKYQVAKIDLSYESDAAVESIEKMQRDNMLSTSEEEQNLENLKKVMRKFEDSVKAIFSESGDDSEWAIFDENDLDELEAEDLEESINVRIEGNGKVKIFSKGHLQQTINKLIATYAPNVNLNHLDVSNVTDMSYLFYKSKFNGDISEWDVSNVTNMKGMFSGSQFNGDLSGWDVSNVKDMSWMFKDSQFNGDISGWDVLNVRNILGMFIFSQFNGDLSDWNARNVTSMFNMFDDSPLANNKPWWYRK